MLELTEINLYISVRSDIMYCMHCGGKIADNSRFCKYCGKLVAEDEINTANNDVVSEDETDEIACEREIEAAENNIDEKSQSGTVYSDIIEEAVRKTEMEPNVEIVDDYIFEHMSTGRKIGLFVAAVVLTAVVACTVFAVLFPELV